MAKEKIISCAVIPNPVIRLRDTTVDADKKKAGYDRERNKIISLWEEKMLYPYKLDNGTVLRVITSKRTINIPIPKGFIWNGANITRILWTVLGISKDSPKIRIASMVHDYLLYEKYTCYQQFNNDNDLDFKEFRRLTTLILVKLSEYYGANKLQQFSIGKAVAAWQWCSPQWWGFRGKFEDYLNEGENG